MAYLVPRVDSRRGISLLEVLMTIFIIAVGLASVFALFMAGRELDARAARKSEAAAVAEAIGVPLVDAWCDVSQWQFVDPVTNRLQWAKVGASIAIPLPVLVDPWGLTRDEFGEDNGDNPPVTDPVIAGAPDTNWGLNRFVPALGSPRPFTRVTLPAIVRTGTPAENPPLSREEAVSGFAGPDALEFLSSTNDALPPLPLFELGRRKRGTDFIPALFISTPGTGNVAAINTDLVSRWLLVFHKPAAAYLEREGYASPFGCHQFYDDRDARRSSPDLLEVRPDTFGSGDATDIARAFQPGKWILLTLENPNTAETVAGCIRRLISATRDEDEANSLLLAIDVPLPWWGQVGVDDPDNKYFVVPGTATLAQVRAYGFESLIHVQEILPPSALTGL